MSTPLDPEKGQAARRRSSAPPTVTDVALEAGVSHATAARALGGYGSVSAAARTKVVDAAERLGYRRNSLASSMVTGRTQTIGFVGADIGNPFFARALRGISDVAREAGVEVVIANTDEDPELERAALRVLGEKRVDGVIVAPAELERPTSLLDLIQAGTPVVCLDRAVPNVDADAVLVDNVRASRAGVERLLELGHRRIGLITTALLGSDPLQALAAVALDPIHALPAAARSVGYLAALHAAGIEPEPELVGTCTFSRTGAAEATRRLLSLPLRPTALFTVDNVRTIGAFDALLESSLSCPEQVSLLGFDDLEWTTIVRPSLTVVDQPAYELGAAAARRLLARLAGDESPAQLLLLDAMLVERESVGSVNEVTSA